MSHDKSVAALRSQITQLRERVHGIPFDDASDAYKDLEAAKVRLNVALNPNHYRDAYGRRKERS